MIKIVYKIVTCRGSTMESMYGGSSFENSNVLTYHLEKTTSPKFSHSKIFTFDTHENARVYFVNQMSEWPPQRRSIIKCVADVPEDQNVSKYFVYPDATSIKDFLTKDGQGPEENDDFGKMKRIQIPVGTVFANWVFPIEIL